MITIQGFSQSNYYNQGNKESMKLLQKIIGNWEGEGWITNRETGKKESFKQKETIQFSLDSTIILINGVGTENGKVIHDAFAVFSVNPEGGYYFTSFLGNGLSGKYDAIEKNGDIIWTIPTASGTVRYTIAIKNDQWVEKGIFETNGQSYPFFETVLKRKN